MSAKIDTRVTVRPGGAPCLSCGGDERPGYVYVDAERPRWDECRDCRGTGLEPCACCKSLPVDANEFVTVCRERVVPGCDDVGSETSVCALGLCLGQQVCADHELQSLIVGYWTLGHSTPLRLARAQQAADLERRRRNAAAAQDRALRQFALCAEVER